MSQYINGLVSVIIPTYKRSDMLLTAIESVLSQTYEKIELIVVNDNTIGDEYSQVLYRLLEDVHDDRMIFLEQEHHINGAAARNVGIRAAKGEFIAFQDDDDYWDKNKIERQVSLLSSLDDSWGAVACLKKFFSDGKLVGASLPYRSGNILLELLEGEISLGTGAVLIRHKALDDSGYFDERLNRHQDIQLFVRLASKYKIKLDKVYMHNREIKDTQNRPTADNIIRIKKAYFHSVQDLIEQYPKRIQNRIYSLHYFEAAYCFFREGKYRQSLKLCISVLKSPISFGISCKKIIEKIVTSKFRNILVKKYSNNG